MSKRSKKGKGGNPDIKRIYSTRWNYTTPFLVAVFRDGSVAVHEEIMYDAGPCRSKKIAAFNNVTKVFVGKSPRNKMTEFSGGYGKPFDGNCMLLQLNEASNEYTYIFIGKNWVYKFYLADPIVRFVSPVGNNDVPYPYAVTESGHVFLPLERVLLYDVPTDEESPYELYDKNVIFTKQDLKARGIKSFYVGGRKTKLRFTPFPYQAFYKLSRKRGQLSVVLTDGSEKDVTVQQFIDWMDSFGEQHSMTGVDIAEYIYKRPI